MSNKMNEKEIPFVPPSYPLQPPAFSAVRADTGRPAPVAFSCSIAHISNWLGFGLFTYIHLAVCVYAQVWAVYV